MTTSCANLRNKSDSNSGRKAPRLVVVTGTEFLEGAVESLKRREWDVFPAGKDDAVCAAIGRNPQAVVIPVDGAVESGYLTAMKLRVAKPKLRVVLVGVRTPKAEAMARFVGAEFASEADGVVGLLTAFARA